MRPAGDGHSVADHMAIVRQRQDKATAEAEPELPPEAGYLWSMWADLHNARGSGALGPNPISWLEISAFSQVTDERIEPWEARAIRAVDNAFMASLASED